MDQSSRIFEAIVWAWDPFIAAIGKCGESGAVLREVYGDAVLLAFVEYLPAYEPYGMRQVWLARRGGGSVRKLGWRSLL